MKLLGTTGINTKNKGFSHPPFQWILSPSRCRSSRWPRRWTGTGPSPSSESPYDQCLRKSSAPVSCRDRKANTETMHRFQNSDVSPWRSKVPWRNSLPELHDGRRHISVDCLVDWRVSPLKFHTVFWGERGRTEKFWNVPHRWEEPLLCFGALPVFQVLLQDDQARSQEKEKDR